MYVHNVHILHEFIFSDYLVGDINNSKGTAPLYNLLDPKFDLASFNFNRPSPYIYIIYTYNV